MVLKVLQDLRSHSTKSGIGIRKYNKQYNYKTKLVIEGALK